MCCRCFKSGSSFCSILNCLAPLIQDYNFIFHYFLMSPWIYHHQLFLLTLPLSPSSSCYSSSLYTNHLNLCLIITWIHSRLILFFRSSFRIWNPSFLSFRDALHVSLTILFLVYVSLWTWLYSTTHVIYPMWHFWNHAYDFPCTSLNTLLPHITPFISQT